VAPWTSRRPDEADQSCATLEPPDAHAAGHWQAEQVRTEAPWQHWTRPYDLGANMHSGRAEHRRTGGGSLSTELSIQLLGRPRLEVDGTSGYRFRSRKSWAVLAFLLLGERPPTRSQLASLLFSEADDPLRALRWCLAEIRRGLGPDSLLDGDPVQLTLPVGATVDVDVLVHGHWREAVDLPGLGADLLDGLTIQNAAAFESWLLVAAAAALGGRRVDPARGRAGTALAW
jgi:hypothetical protein